LGVGALLGLPYFFTDGKNYTVNETAIYESVAEVRDHPALVAYYVCDDCCKGDAFTHAPVRESCPHSRTRRIRPLLDARRGNRVEKAPRALIL